MSAPLARSGRVNDCFRADGGPDANKKLNKMPFPTHRMRRLRSSGRIRNLVRETRLSPESMIYPIFVCPGEKVRKEIGSMPGQFNLSVDNAVKVAREAEQ